MAKTNLTLTVDPEVLKRARIRALEQDTSVNEVLARFLDAWAGSGARDQAEAVRRLLATAAKAQGDSQGWKWNREELYDRPSLRRLQRAAVPPRRAKP